MITNRERFIATIERKPVDHPASWLGMPTHEALPGLFAYFGVADTFELKRKIADDLFVVDIPYLSPVSTHVAFAFDFGKEGPKENTERTLTTPGWFADKEDPKDVDAFSWPDPKEHIDRAAIKTAIASIPKDSAQMVAAWSIHYEATCAAFGMEQALVAMLTNTGLFSAVMRRITDFFLEANEIFYSTAGDSLDAVLIGNDLGTQRGLLLSPEHIRRFVLPGTKELVDQAHSYGLKVVHHSCGSIDAIIPELIEVGVDAIHPIQALAAGMEARSLRDRFGDKVSFCGGVDAQQLLVNGNPADVRKKVLDLRAVFPSGLVLSPSHEAILKDIRPENIKALFEAVRE
ncbi:MAG: uroporphyrinogen decarboxylase family protein [Spirochaetota bacterium]